MTNGGKTGFCGKQRREQWLDVGGREAGTTQSPSRETPWQSCRCESKPRQVLPEGMPPASITQSSDPSLPHSGPWTAAHGDTTAAGFSRHGATARRGREEHEPSPGDLPNTGIEPRSPSLQVDSLPAEPPGKPFHTTKQGKII